MPHPLPTTRKQARSAHSQTPRPLIIAAASARSLAAAAVAAECRVLCTDFFGDEDLRELLDRSGGTYLGQLDAFTDLPGLLTAVPPDVPLLWAGGLENHLELLHHIASARPLLGLPLDVVAKLRDPATLMEFLSHSGTPEVRFPPSVVGAVPPAGRWLWKPAGTSGGLGVQRLTEDLRRQLAASAWTSRGCFQQELDGLPCSVVVACDGGAVEIVGMSLQFCGLPELHAEEFRFCGNLGPLEIPPRLATALRGVLVALLQQCGEPSGIFGVDLLLTSDICWLLEINPRIPASHWIYEVPGCWNAVSCSLRPGAVFRMSPASRPKRAQLIIWTRERISFPDIPAEELLRSQAVWIADHPGAGAEVPAGSPVCSLLLEQTTGAGIQQISAAVRGIPASLSSELGIRPSNVADAIIGRALQWQTLADAWN